MTQERTPGTGRGGVRTEKNRAGAVSSGGEAEKKDLRGPTKKRKQKEASRIKKNKPGTSTGRRGGSPD